jgi:thiamine pyrophosphate-dependent acetolactate synthase large subunit-like protein
VSEPDGPEALLSEALAATGSSMVELVVDPDTLIVPPTINASQADHFGLTKLRELLVQ